MDYSTIEDAFLYVNGGQYGQNRVVISRSTGEVYYASELTGDDELPDDVEENDDYVSIPHQNDLNLGKPLVFDFVSQRCPEEFDRVRAIFARKGAYSRYKDFLADKGLLEEWYAFESARTREELLEWCALHDLKLEEQGHKGLEK